MKKTIVIATVICISLFSINLGAQKIGHINSMNLIESLEVTKKADAQLESFSKPKLDDFQAKMEAFQSRYNAAAQLVAQGGLSPNEVASKEAELVAEQNTLKELDGKLQLEIAQKREELIQPILKRVQDAIQEVAKEGGFTYIIDESTGVLLSSANGMDISELVRAKVN